MLLKLNSIFKRDKRRDNMYSNLSQRSVNSSFWLRNDNVNDVVLVKWFQTRNIENHQIKLKGIFLVCDVKLVCDKMYCMMIPSAYYLWPRNKLWDAMQYIFSIAKNKLKNTNMCSKIFLDISLYERKNKCLHMIF